LFLPKPPAQTDSHNEEGAAVAAAIAASVPAAAAA